MGAMFLMLLLSIYFLLRNSRHYSGRAMENETWHSGMKEIWVSAWCQVARSAELFHSSINQGARGYHCVQDLFLPTNYQFAINAAPPNKAAAPTAAVGMAAMPALA